MLIVDGNIAVKLVSSYAGLNSIALLHICLFGWIQSSQTGDQLYSDMSPY